MNYQKIYSAFIADRRQIEDPTGLLDAYVEKHHILPRALGGDDSPENLIRLTPEDHFFAHLLLAKIHGGKMWAPIAFMVGGSRKDYKPTQSRKAHGWAMCAAGSATSRENGTRYDPTIHELVNGAGEVVQVTQSEMHHKLGLGRPLANLLVKGRISTAKGWSIVGSERKTLAGDKHHMHRPEVREFRNVNGDVFTGTQLEFSDAKKMRRPDVSRLVNGIFQTTKGWYLAERGIPGSSHAKAKWQKHLSR